MDTRHTDVSKTVTPENYLIPVCQPALSITMNMVEDLGNRPAGQGKKEALSPAISHVVDSAKSNVPKTDILCSLNQHPVSRKARAFGA